MSITKYWKMWFYITILKNMKNINGKDDIPYMKWNIKIMFETTNQNDYGVQSFNGLHMFACG